MSHLIRSLTFLGLMLFSLSGLAAALVETVAGDVKAGGSASTAITILKDQRIQPGSVVVTGPKSRVLLRFDDGQAIALNENTEFKIAAYSYARDDAKKDNIALELFKGAMRSVSGLLSRRNPQAYSLRTTVATIGIRGTDFMVAVVNPTFMRVIDGTITASNAAGTVAFGPGATAAVASATTLPAAIAASALPASVAASFSQLGSLTIAAGTGAAGAVGAATGGVTVGTIAAAAAVVGIAAAVSSSDSTSTTGTTGTTP
ncbi:MAG: FecR family protein [Burkholderiales bacterium]|nr:FecR family protein [Burkholderiales bacterium]